MLSNTMRLAFMGAILTFGLVGCAGKGGSGSDSASNKSMKGNSGMASTQGYGSDSGFAEEDSWGRSQKELLAQRTFRFGFDRFDLSSSDQEAVAAHAEYLASHPNKKVRVEGHTDERGSREYNVALGERRAKTVTQVLLSHGVSQNQIATVSYGEEKPETGGHDESAYGMNRRSVIVYE